MHQRRHHALGIDLEVFGVVLLVIEKVDYLFFPVELFLVQGDENFLCAD